MQRTTTADVTGYASAEYAEALGEFGRPRRLPRSGGWILERPIPTRDGWRDAIGCYPICACADWSLLRADLDAIGDDLVSLVLVADPFGSHSNEDLRVAFPDLCVAYKQHFVVDLDKPLAEIVSPHHARNVRRASQAVVVERCARPAEHLADWVRLYGVLVERHAITGVSAFSAASFAAQLRVPGLTAFRALRDGAVVGMILWLIAGDVGYYHLAAYSMEGYDLRASFALFAESIRYFHDKLRWLNLGAGAGAHGAGHDGLARFKQGWSTGTRAAYLCGRVFDRDRYAALAAAMPAAEGTSSYFPAYRRGEFR